MSYRRHTSIAVSTSSTKYDFVDIETLTTIDCIELNDDIAEKQGTGMTKTKVLNVRLPQELIRLLDDFVDNSNFNSRSEAIREFARQYVLENGGGNNAG